MSKKTFRFRQFTVYHDMCTMKVGSDAVLLGAWTDVKPTERVLDIGTGSGVVALMLAQRGRIGIDAIDIDKSSVRQASENFGRSPWSAKLTALHCAAQEFCSAHKGGYDLIVSNPPFFSQGLPSPNPRRLIGRHDVLLSAEDLLMSVRRLMHASGRFVLILPYATSLEFIARAGYYKFICRKKLLFRTGQKNRITRSVMEFSYTKGPCEVTEMRPHDLTGGVDRAFYELTKEYYLFDESKKRGPSVVLDSPAD